MNLDDGAPIERALELIDKLVAGMQNASTVIAKDGHKIGEEYAFIATNAKKLVTELEKVTIAQKNNQDLIMNGAKQTEALADAAAKNTEAQKQNKKAQEDNAKATEDLNKAKDALLKGQATELGSLDALKKQLDAATKSYYAMGDATDQTVKEDQLKKVEELNKKYTESKKVLDNAKKSTAAAAGSYDELSKRVAEGKKELKAMEGSMEGNSKEFQKLKKEVADGTKKLKDWDSEVGDNTRRVGAYKEEIAQLVPGFGAVSQGATQSGKALLALAANPVGIVILAIAAALGTLTAWFTRTETGGDKLQEMLGGITGIFTFLLDQLAVIGGALFEALSKPEKIFQSVAGAAKNLKEQVLAVFRDPLPAIKAFGQFLLDQVVNRFTGMIKTFGYLGEAMKSLFQGDFAAFQTNLKGLANSALQVATGVENVIDKVASLIEESGMSELLARAKAIGTQIAQLKDKLEDQEVALIKKRADTELKVAELLLKAKDKLRFSDEDRFKAIKEVTKQSESLLASEIAAAQTKIAIAQKEIALRKLSLKDAEIPLDLIKAQSEAEAELIGLKARRLQEQKRLQQQEISIIREIETENRARMKREFDAETNLAKVRSEIRVRELNQIANDAKQEVDVRNQALIDIAAEQQKQLEISAQQQQQAAKESALERIELDAETLDNIYNNQALSVEQRIQKERELKEARLSEDKAYVQENEKIQEDLVSKTKEVNDKMLEAVQKNVFTQLQTDLERLKDKVSQEGAEMQAALNEQFAEGNISVSKYEKQRKEITAETNRQILYDSLMFLQTKLELLRQDGANTADVENQIAQTRLQLSQMTTDQLIENEKKVNQMTEQVAYAAVDLAQTVFDARIQQNIEYLEKQLALEEDAKNRRLDIVGQDAQARAAIEQNFANKQKEIQQQIAQEKRKAAIFEKARSSTEIILNTARASVAALPNIPLSILTAAFGALQLAKVLSTPIPAFALGTDYSPEGFALVGEAGREIGIDPSGRAVVYDRPQVTYLKEGTKILPNDITESIFKDSQFHAENFLISNREPIPVVVDVDGIIDAISVGNKMTSDALRRMPKDYYDESGYRRYERNENGRVRRLDDRYRLLS